MDELHLSAEFDADLRLLLESINIKYNYDFRQYAHKSLKRTVTHALSRMGCATVGALQEKILHDEKCFDELIQSLTISVSEMFRDPSYFLAVREFVVPVLKTYPSVKLWVAGCSTGEEVYSLAILFEEEELLARTTIYATDINPRSLGKAEKGVFDLAILPKFTENYLASGGQAELSSYFTRQGNTLKINDLLKNSITFSDHSLVTDAVFLETHFISCRNVLIYFDRELQDRALGLFQESLCRKGFLGLGSKESLQLSKHVKGFTPFVKKARIFQRN